MSDDTPDIPEKKPKGFAAISPERRRAISSLGGKAVPPQKRTFATDPVLASEAGRIGGTAPKLPKDKKP